MITWRFEADFDRNDTYESNLTRHIGKPGNGYSISRGLTPDGHYQVSKLTVQLHNYDGRFNPRNMNGPYYGKLSPDIPVRLVATYDGDDYTLWTGYVTRMSQEWRAGSIPVVSWECHDIGHYLNDSVPVNLTVTQRRTDEAIAAIADAIGLDEEDTVLDTGVETMPLHYALAESAMSAMMNVVRSERGGMLWVDALGRIRFEARDSRLGVSPDYTWGSGTHLRATAVQDLYDDYDYLTTARVRHTVFHSGQSDIEIFRFSRGESSRPTADSIELAAGATYRRTFTGVSGYIAITEPEAGVDYRGNDSIDGSGEDRTDALDVTLTDHGGGRFTVSIRNTHSGPVFITLFKLRGQPIQFFADRPEAEITLPVPGRPTGKSVGVDVPFGVDSTYGALEYAYQIVRTYRYPIPRLTVQFIGVKPQGIKDLLSCELGEQVAYSDMSAGARLSMSDDVYYIDAINIHVPAEWAGQALIAEIVLTPSYVYRDLSRIVVEEFDREDGSLGSTTNGKTWANAGHYAIVSQSAVPQNDSPTSPTIDVGVADMVVEATIEGLA